MRPPLLRLYQDEMVVDNFAGGGGASTGIKLATGRDPDIAVNHDPQALAIYRANHANTRVMCEDVFDVNPRFVCKGRKVGLAWFSPDCTFFSKARGKKPHRDRNRARRRRGLAGVVLKWAAQVRPRVIFVENVEEFKDWGPLGDDGHPDPKRTGENFSRWVARLRNLGYAVEWKELRACDFGAPTTRKRLFINARNDGEPITWPEPTHGPKRAQPYRTAAECIDWTIPCPSIFMSREEARDWKQKTGTDIRRPLSDKTMRRIAAGIQRYVINTSEPFIVPLTHDGGERRVYSVKEPFRTVTGANRGEMAIVAPVLIQTSWGERQGQRPRYLDIHEPIGTIMADGIKHSVAEVRLERADRVAAFMVKHFGGEHKNGKPKSGAGSDARRPLDTITGRDHNYVVMTHLMNMKGSMAARNDSSSGMNEPTPTICANGTHVAEVRAFLLKYYGTDQDPRLNEPMHTLTTKDRMALVIVTIGGEEYAIVDIGMRMLTPRELYRAQGFPADYVIDPVVDGKPLSKTEQVHKCGNSVPPPFSEALVLAAFGAREEAAIA